MEEQSEQGPQRSETHEEWLTRDAEERLLRFENGEISRKQYIKEQVGMRLRLEELAEHDSLTGLLNRRGFERVLEQRIKHDRSHGHPVSLVLLDIDDFKQYNDALGHAEGDKVLKIMAKALPRFGETGRWGGEEMVVLLPDIGASQLEEVVSNMGRTIRQQTLINASIGAVTLRDGEKIRDTIDRADQLMYEAKKDGRNRGFVDVGKEKPAQILFG